MPYRDLTRDEFDAVVQMLAEGFQHATRPTGCACCTTTGQRATAAERGARLAALTSGGAIPDNADYRVVLEPGGTFIGTINEDFAIESLPGDIFQLGNSSWRIQRIEQGRVLVEDAEGPTAEHPVLVRRGALAQRRALRRRVAACAQEVEQRLEESPRRRWTG